MIRTRYIALTFLCAIPLAYYAGVIQIRSETKQTAFVKEAILIAYEEGRKSFILEKLEHHAALPNPGIPKPLIEMAAR